MSSDLRQRLLTGTPLERLVAADEGMRGGPNGWAVLVALACDEHVDSDVRGTAAAALAPPVPTSMLQEVAASLLAASEPELRCRGILMCVRFALVAMLPEVQACVGDPARFWEIDVQVSISALARAATAILHTGEPRPDFPDWAAMGDVADLRASLFRLTDEELGVTATSFPHPVLGVLMETGTKEGWHSLVCLADGTTSLYLSNGGSTFGAGQYESVQRAAAAFLFAAQNHWPDAWPSAATPTPDPGQVTFYLLGRGEVRRLEAPLADLDAGAGPLAPLYVAGHAVLGEVLALDRSTVTDPSTPVVEVPAHELDYPQPESELAFMEQLVADLPQYIPQVPTNLGAGFDDARRLLGLRTACRRPPAEIVAALRALAEIGVALFQRASVGTERMVELHVGGATVRVAGGGYGYASAPRWADAVGAAWTLRDATALASLCAFDPGRFEGAYDLHYDLWAKAIISHARGGDDVLALLDEAATAQATVIPELALRVGRPMIAATRAIVAGDTDEFNRRLAEGLDGYRVLYSRPPRNQQSDTVVPLVYLGLAALAHDQGMACRVVSDYIPAWLVDGTWEGR